MQAQKTQIVDRDEPKEQAMTCPSQSLIGPVEEMHRMIERRMAGSQMYGSGWDVDHPGNLETAIRLMSRSAGIVALILGVAATARVITMIAG